MIDINCINLDQINSINRYNTYYSSSFIESLGAEVVKSRLSIVDKPYYRAYYNIINRTSSLLHKLKFSSPLEYCVAYEYLLWNGFFSLNHQLVYSMNNRINLLALTGADIMLGKSVCLNNSEMLTNLLNNLGYKAYTFGCDLKGNLDSLIYRPPIHREKVEPSLINKIIANLLEKTSIIRRGNHAITAFVSKDNVTFCDPTSLAFLNYSDFLKAKYIGSDIEVAIKPWLTAMLSKMNKAELDYIVYHSLNPNKSLTIAEIKSITEQTIRACEDNKSLLESFYQSNQKAINVIVKTINKK